ncbi:MAG TPA: hypothetical protein VMI54_05345 [Polyangiaceae bacterium]|nr:hypothetical protein [Polyangiaceae bacterium]
MRFAPALALALLTGCDAVAGIHAASERTEPGVEAAGSASTPPAGATCATHADCLTGASAEFDPYACIEGACVRLMSDECQLLLPSSNQWLQNLRSGDADPLIFGIFTIYDQHLDADDTRNFDLALTDVTEKVIGIPAVNDKRRPLVGVACNSGTLTSPLSEDQLDRAMDHLTLDLGVTGILSDLQASDLERAFRYRGYDRHVFFMNALGAEENVQTLMSDGLIWSILPPGTDLVPVYQPLVDRAVAHLRSNGTLGATENARVAIVIAQNVPVLNDIGSAVVNTLSINGKAATDQNAGGDFLEITVFSPSGEGAPSVDTDAILQLKAFKPHIVVSATGDEFLKDYIPLIEEANPPLAPMYVLSEWDYGQTDALASLVTSSKLALHERLIGVNYAEAPEQHADQAYQLHFDAKYAPQSNASGLENFYDAAYYFFYSAAASGMAWPLQGHDMVNGMRRLLSGNDPFDVGPDDLERAVVELETPDASITLNGTMGPPNFSSDGVRHTPGSVYCIDQNGDRRSDVLTLDGDGKLTSEEPFPCFDF